MSWSVVTDRLVLFCHVFIWIICAGAFGAPYSYVTTERHVTSKSAGVARSLEDLHRTETKQPKVIIFPNWKWPRIWMRLIAFGFFEDFPQVETTGKLKPLSITGASLSAPPTADGLQAGFFTTRWHLRRRKRWEPSMARRLLVVMRPWKKKRSFRGLGKQSLQNVAKWFNSQHSKTI